MAKSGKTLPRSPTPGRKSLKIRHLSDPPRPSGGVNSGSRTGDKDRQRKKSMLSQADLKAFRKVMSHYGSRAAGVPKTMSKAAIEQRRAAGRSSAIKRGFKAKSK